MPWHPALVAATIVLSAWLDAAVSPYAAIRALLITIGLAVTVTLTGWAVTRSAAIGGLVATTVLIGLWSRLPITTMAEFIGRMGTVIGLLWLLLIGAVVALVVRRTRHRWSVVGATTLLNRASLLLLLATILSGVVGGRLPALMPDLEQGESLGALGAVGAEDAPDLPDIYAILLDGYPRADVLDYAFDFDNAPFISALEERGFDVAQEAHSTYLWTHVSLPSILNMAYVEQIPSLLEVIDGERPRQPTLRRAVADNQAFKRAREAGYTTVAVASGFEEVALRQADVYVDGGQLNEFEISLLTGTFAADLLRPIWPDFGSGQQRDRIRYNLSVLPEIASRADASDVLVLAHVPAPHQPVVFGKNGVPVAEPLAPRWFADSPGERGQDPAGFRERYRAQLPVINDLVLEAIDGILAASEEPSVIVLLADHGSASVVDWNATTPDEADPARVLERTGILLAALTPERDRVLPSDTVVVDVFRLLFDAYLGTHYGPATPPVGGGQISPIEADVLGTP